MAVEEQTEHDVMFAHIYVGKPRAGQKLTIANRKVTKLGFWICKIGSPTGDVTFAIRRVSDDSVILSKRWGDASELVPDVATYEEVTFDSPTTINEDVRLSCEWAGPGGVDYIDIYAAEDVKDDEYSCLYDGSSWTAYTDYDLAYRYTYSVGPPPKHTFRLHPRPGHRMKFHPNLKLG